MLNGLYTEPYFLLQKRDFYLFLFAFKLVSGKRTIIKQQINIKNPCSRLALCIPHPYR